MDKETMVQIHNGIVPSLKKEGIWASSNEVDASRAYYTELDKSEKEKQISYINVHVWNLERWYWWTYLQDSNEDADIENRLLDTVGEKKGGMIWESRNETYALPFVK